LAKRCNLSELTTFLTALVQADQLGISIKSVLKVQSENLRKERSQRAEEKALKAPVKMLVPMVVFIFPVIFIILLGPAVVNIMDVF
jgi:tight adherence protein C